MLGRGDERMVRCPFHDDASPSCSVNLEKKVFVCFACGEKGTILDFVARMECCSLRAAAQIVARWCDLPHSSPTFPEAGKPSLRPRSDNEPLDFALHLDPAHPYLAERGLSREMIAKFGLGYCDRGLMKGRICIPVHDVHGNLVAYAGRWPGSTLPKEEPRYRLPRGFRKRSVLFNYHRVAGEPHLVIVEDYWSVFRLDALGIASVALMGRTLSQEQEVILKRSQAQSFTLLLDGDEAGRAAIPSIVVKLARQRFVRAPDLPPEAEPDVLAADDLMAVLCLQS